MKKALFGVALFILPIVCSAQTVGFTDNLYYGLTNNSEVQAWQEFLTTQGFKVPNTGNFFSLTLAATKAFQSAETVSPVSGFVGPITRGVANAILAQEVPVEEGNATTTSQPVDLSTTTPFAPVYTPPVSRPTPTPITAPTTPNQTFGSVALPPTCLLTGTTTPSTYYEQSGTIDWTSSNADSISMIGTNLPHVIGGSATYQITPVSSGEIRDLPITMSGESVFTATVNGVGGTATCQISLP